MAGERRLRKEAEWRERLARFGRAGTSVVQFCDDEGISPPAFYAWRKRLGAGATALQADDAAASLDQQHGLFAPVRVTGTAQGGNQVTVWLRGGTRLEIPLADPNVAGTVLGAILQADAERAGGQPC
jgi:hypothetical protein